MQATMWVGFSLSMIAQSVFRKPNTAEVLRPAAVRIGVLIKA